MTLSSSSPPNLAGTTDSPHLVLDSPLFRGVELEGPYRGLKTLFIASAEVTLSNVQGYLPTVEAVYFGAGRLGSVNWELLRQTAGLGTHLVTVELGRRPLNDIEQCLLSVDALRRSRHLVVLTAEMRLPSGAHHSFWPEATMHADTLRALGLSAAVKQDDGKCVTLTYKGQTFVNRIDVTYADDVRLPLL